MTRRSFALQITALASGAALANERLAAGADDGISNTAESIHQEVAIAAAPKRVYAALTDAAQFTKVTGLGGMTGVQPAEIGRAEGQSFSLFGGVIIGRHVELVPDRRIVQAWRETSWEPGVYSLVKFDLRPQAGGTLIVFDHTGFPMGAAAHLAPGWGEHYWGPLKKFLALS
jgi:uncharacterized protein YndB with AHSA1/START domain